MRVEIDNGCEGLILDAPNGIRLGMICQIQLDDGRKMLGWIKRFV